MDENVLEAELRALHSASFGWALACCNYQRDDAEDVLQTVYLKIIEGRARFGEESSLKTWLFGVIRITAQEKRRRKLRERLGLARFGIYQTGFAALKKYEADAPNQATLAVREALRSLPHRQREVLELVFYHDLTIENAAEIMDVSIGTARTHYERGKRKLRDKLNVRKR